MLNNVVNFFYLNLCRGTFKPLDNSWIVKMIDLNSTRFLSVEIYFAILDKWSFWLAKNSVYMIFKWKVIYIPNSFSQLLLSMMEPLIFTENRFIMRNKQITIRSICFQVEETETFKQFSWKYFKVIHDFIKCRFTFVRNGIISKVCEFKTMVLKK